MDIFAAGYDNILNIEKSCTFKLAVTPNGSNSENNFKKITYNVTFDKNINNF